MSDVNDPQNQAEQLDDDVVGGDDSAVTSDQVAEDFPPDQLQGVPFADADITDESFAQRTAQEQPELTERDIDVRDA